MEKTMPYITVQADYQIKIPTALREKMGLHAGDTLKAVADGDGIRLSPAHVQDETDSKSSLLSLRGINKGSGLYKSADEVDQCIRNLRDEWE